MGKQWKQCQTLCFGAPKITADGDCSHEIKKRLLLRRKVMTNLDSILKSKDITLSVKVCLVKAMVFPVVVYGCESWTVKKAEHWRFDALNCGVGEDSWESLGLQGDQTNQSQRKSVLNIHWKDWSWSWIFSPLAIWCKYLAHSKRLWSWERLKVEGEGDNRGWDGWMASLAQWTWAWVSTGVGDGQGSPVCYFPWGHRVRYDWVTELNWTDPSTWSMKKTLNFCVNITDGNLLIFNQPSNHSSSSWIQMRYFFFSSLCYYSAWM